MSALLMFLSASPFPSLRQDAAFQGGLRPKGATSVAEVQDLSQDLLQDLAVNSTEFWFQCPSLPAPTRSIHSNLSLEEASEIVGEENCAERSRVYMCGFPPAGLNIGVPDHVARGGVINMNWRLFNEHVREPARTDIVWIVEFYSDWCPHCKSFAPKWLALGSSLFGGGRKTRLASVNCEVHGWLCYNQGVLGYPTIKFYSRLSGVFQSGTLMHTVATLKEYLARLPEDYSVSNEDMDAALALASAVVPAQGQCPPARAVPEESNFSDSGWPTGENESTNESRVAEAGFMLVYTLKNWVAPQSLPQKNVHKFDTEDLLVIKGWLQLLVNNFPKARKELSELLAEVSLVQYQFMGICVSTWLELLGPLERALGTRPPAGPGACTTDTCRVWTLFHVLSVAPAVCSKSRSSPEATNAGIAAFIERYFRCQHCRTHAMDQYRRKAYGLRDLQSREGVAIYWWRFHNAVSVRIAAEGGCSADRRWPPPDLCPSCWEKSDGAWWVLEEAREIFKHKAGGSLKAVTGNLPVESEVLTFLKQTYSLGPAGCSGVRPQTGTGASLQLLLFAAYLAAIAERLTIR